MPAQRNVQKQQETILVHESTELTICDSRMVSVCNCKQWLLLCVIVLLCGSILVDVAVAQCSGKFMLLSIAIHITQ